MSETFELGECVARNYTSYKVVSITADKIGLARSYLSKVVFASREELTKISRADAFQSDMNFYKMIKPVYKHVKMTCDVAFQIREAAQLPEATQRASGLTKYYIKNNTLIALGDKIYCKFTRRAHIITGYLMHETDVRAGYNIKIDYNKQIFVVATVDENICLIVDNYLRRISLFTPYNKNGQFAINYVNLQDLSDAKFGDARFAFSLLRDIFKQPLDCAILAASNFLKINSSMTFLREETLRGIKFILENLRVKEDKSESKLAPEMPVSEMPTVKLEKDIKSYNCAGCPKTNLINYELCRGCSYVFCASCVSGYPIKCLSCRAPHRP